MINEPDIADINRSHMLREIFMVGRKALHQFPEIASPSTQGVRQENQSSQKPKYGKQTERMDNNNLQHSKCYVESEYCKENNVVFLLRSHRKQSTGPDYWDLSGTG